jgi:hypothetical protein
VYELNDDITQMLNKMDHTVGDLGRPVVINYFPNGGTPIMTSQYNDNSTNISGGNVEGNQFASGSQGFQGTLTITKTQGQKLENLTESLIKSLKTEPPMEGANAEEVVDAVNQVRNEAKKKNSNKLSLNGMLTGINMVMTNVKNLSQNTQDVYSQWHDYIQSLF